MESNRLEDHLKKLREQRLAREKARIEKLKELNLKKYSKLDDEAQLHPKPVSTARSLHSSIPRPSLSHAAHSKPAAKSNVPKKDVSKRCSSAPPKNDPRKDIAKPKTVVDNTKQSAKKIVNAPSENLVNKTKKIKDITTKRDTKPVLDKSKARESNLSSKIPRKPLDVGADPKKSVSSTSNVTDNVSTKKADDQSTSSTSNVTDNNATKKAYDKSDDDKVAIKSSGSKANVKLTTQNTIDTKTSNKNKLASVNKNRNEMRRTICFGSSYVPIPSKAQSHSKLTTPRPVPRPAKSSESGSALSTTKENVFDRLYKSKKVSKSVVDDVTKLKTDPDFLKKVIKDANMLTRRRYTVHEPEKVQKPVRRSISAFHFKKASKNDINNCIQKWSSIGEKLDKLHLEDIDEDEKVNQDRVISAVKSERKKVKFQTPVPYNFNTPKPDELQEKLQKWLEKRGKSLDSFQHLQCFGLHHLTYRIKPLNFENVKVYNDENKENIPLDSDSDDDSYHEIMDQEVNGSMDKKSNDSKSVDTANSKWRRASIVSDSVDLNESHCSQDLTLTSMETPLKTASGYVNELLLGALADLTEILREGYDWDQCARWLRAIRDQYPSAPETAAYWECRAVLEDRRGDLPTSIHCWEEAIAKGTQHSVAEANLDQLLDKFMQLKISPNSGKRQVDPKMVDMKNIFKSTIIKFAVQQAKLRQSTASPNPKYICTPVRRSARLSTARTPLQLCSSVKQATELHDAKFVPNDKLITSP